MLLLLFGLLSAGASGDPCSLERPISIGEVKIEEIYANRMTPVRWKNAVFASPILTEEIDSNCKAVPMGVELFGIWNNGQLVNLGGARVFPVGCGQSFTGFNYGYLSSGGPGFVFQGGIFQTPDGTTIYETYYFERKMRPGELEAPQYRMLMRVRENMVTSLEITVPIYKLVSGMLMEYEGRNETLCLKSAELAP